MKIIDAHSHIDYITHNIQPGVVGTICSATNKQDWDVLIKHISKDNNIYGAFGIHPWLIDDVSDDFESRLFELLKSDDSYMVGEIGLDKYKPNMDKQIDIFVRQLDIAVKLQRIVFLHCVGAWDKIFHILKKYRKSELPTTVAHDFNGNIDILNRLISNYNFMFSIHRANTKSEIERIENIPINKILVESDGKNNIVLSDIVDKISNIKNDPMASDIIYNNTKRILNK